MMLRLGRWMTLIGALLVAVGLILGLGGLFSGMGQGALVYLMLASLGFVLAFVGVTLVVLLEPRDDPNPPL